MVKATKEVANDKELVAVIKLKIKMKKARESMTQWRIGT
jgi:hypothetical protein